MKLTRQRALDRLGMLFPGFFWRQYASQARRQGFKRLYLVLSFDCDTPEDIQAAAPLDDWLRQHGFKTTYAVPGAQLQQGAAVYRQLADSGAEFINHGARPHTVWNGERYQSDTFYARMTPEEVVADIRSGHEIVSQVTGRPPLGFRAPHFGLLGQPELEIIYATLRSLDYRFATTTGPRYGIWHGPRWRTHDLLEFPLTGSYASPFILLDSFRHIVSRSQRVVKDSYAASLTATVEQLLAHHIPGLLNIYVDPSMVAPNQAFYRAFERIQTLGIPSLHYRDLLQDELPQ